jgi:hypothetical protein
MELDATEIFTRTRILPAIYNNSRHSTECTTEAAYQHILSKTDQDQMKIRPMALSIPRLRKTTML